MKFTSIPQAQVSKYNRMDAGFHIALKEVIDNGMLDKAEASFSADEAVTALGLLSPSQLQAVTKDLVTGSVTNSKSVEMAVNKYPHIALAIALTNFDLTAELLKEKESIESKISRLESVKRKMK